MDGSACGTGTGTGQTKVAEEGFGKGVFEARFALRYVASQRIAAGSAARARGARSLAHVVRSNFVREAGWECERASLRSARENMGAAMYL